MINVLRIDNAVNQYIMKLQDKAPSNDDLRELLDVYREEFGAKAILINAATKDYDKMNCIVASSVSDEYVYEGSSLPLFEQSFEQVLEETKGGSETGIWICQGEDWTDDFSSLFFIAVRGKKIDGSIVAINDDPNYEWTEEHKRLFQGLGRLVRRSIIQNRLESVEIEQNRIAEQLRERINIITSIALEYYCMYYVDLITGEMTVFNHEKNDVLEDMVWKHSRGEVQLDDLIIRYVKLDNQQAMKEFFRTDTLAERLRFQNSISAEFEGIHSGWFEANYIVAKRDSEGNALSVILSMKKITEEKRRELAQTASLNELKEVLSTAGMGTWHIELFDGENPRMIADDKMKLLLGIQGIDMTPEETYEAWFNKIDVDALPSVVASVETIKSGVRDENTYVWHHPTLGPRYVRCGGTSIYVEGKGYILRGYHYDVTDVVENDKRKQRELAEALDAARRANVSKSTFLFNMSHDIRTPMNAIMGYANLLGKHTEDREKQKEYIENIQTSGGYLLSLINNVLEMARIESGNVEIDEEPTDIFEFASNIGVVFEEEYRNHSLTVNRHFDIGKPYVFCDKTKCYEIFLNVISNAIKYTPAGGTIDISMYQTDREDGRIDCTIVVADTGIGMSKQFIPHIFDSFSREKTVTENKIVGTGLGMGIVKRYIDILGGLITVDSDLGAGTTITITLPLRESEKPQVRIDNASNNVDISEFKGKRILIAEDNELNAEIVMEILSEAGFLVEHAEDGVVCIGKLQKAAPDYYDLILMDVQMPIMNGYKATEIIRKLSDPVKANIPIFALTANVFDEDKQNALESGMNGHISKPIDVPVLLDTIAGALSDK